MKLELHDPYGARTEEIWRELTATNPPAYFLSWGWVENWLACLPREQAPRLAVICDRDRPAAAFFLGSRLVMRHGVLPSRAMFFNTTGVQRIDDIYIEYNGLVGEPVALADLIALLPGGWDELFMPALADGAFRELSSNNGVRVCVERTVPTYWVDLERARAKGYLALLSSGTRSQVRRAQREAGDLTIEVATDARQAIVIYSELCALHAAQWRAKGKPGAFADPWFDRFHRRLITQRMRHGEVQLVRVRGASGTIGCVYNLVSNGRVYQYQSGMELFDDPHLKPGYICHAAAIDHSIASGHAAYDFLGGDMRYKKSLSTDAGSLVWARVQRPRVRFLIEDQVRRWRAGVARPHSQ